MITRCAQSFKSDESRSIPVLSASGFRNEPISDLIFACSASYIYLKDYLNQVTARVQRGARLICRSCCTLMLVSNMLFRSGSGPPVDPVIAVSLDIP